MLESDGRVRVVAVMPGSPAARAGLQVGDEIRSVDDQRIRTTEGLTDEICEKQPGAKVELSIRRNGEPSTLHARLASAQELSGNRGHSDRQYASTTTTIAETAKTAGTAIVPRRTIPTPNRARNRSVSNFPALRQQIAQLQEEVDELRNQSAGGTRVGYRNRSNNTLHFAQRYLDERQ